MKIAVIGGGSTYTPELVNGFLKQSNKLPLAELSLMDIDQNRLKIVGEFAKRMVAAEGHPFKISLTNDQKAAIKDSSYVITQLRVGKMEARRHDEYLGKRHGIIGQETTGIGGMAKALRTIPVILEVAKDIQTLSPKALLLNFTNPSGLVTEALFKYAPEIQAVGVCNSGITTKMEFLKSLQKEFGETIHTDRAFLNTLGLNHLTWYRGFTVDGKDVWPQIFEGFLRELDESNGSDWDQSTIKTLGMIPNSYLSYYYYKNKKIENQNNWPPSRAEEVIEIEKKTLTKYTNAELTSLPPELMQRGGAYYSTLATELIDSHYNNLGQIHIVNTRNNKAVDSWPENWIIEIPCEVNARGISPLPTNPLPPVCSNLVSTVKTYELLTVEAAVHGDREAAYQAILTHPLGPDANKIQDLLDDLFRTHKSYLPQFLK